MRAARATPNGRTGTSGALAASALAAALLALAMVPGAPPAGTESDDPAARRPAVTQLPGTDCPVFPADSWWHADVASLPVHPRSTDWLRTTAAAGTDLHPDFGPAFGAQPVPYGIPVTVVRGTHRRVRVRFQYADESDRVRYPLGRDTRIEGGRRASGDRHAIVVDGRRCRLYETWNTRRTARGWRAGSGATWDLRSNDLRPDGWTSADAAGLPILPGLLRWDEVEAGVVDHALRMTVATTVDDYVWPARHRAGATDDLALPPMGARFRLRASYDVSGFSAAARVVLTAMRTYGLVVADNGSDWYVQGTSDRRWPVDLVDELKQVPAAAFEAVDTSGLMVSPDSMQVAR